MPWARAMRPIAAAGLTRPPLVGFHPVIDHAFERCDVELAGGVARHDLDDGAGAAGGVQEGDVVAGVLGLGGEDAVAGGEADGIERHVPGDRGVLDERDFGAVRVQELRNRIVDRFDLVIC
jgi:hypothetical protein